MILQRKVSSKFIKINKINCILHVNRYLFIFYLLSSKYFPTGKVDGKVDTKINQQIIIDINILIC